MNLPFEAVGTKGYNFFSRGSVQIFLWKPIATFDFPVGVTILKYMFDFSQTPCRIKLKFALGGFRFV